MNNRKEIIFDAKMLNALREIPDKSEDIREAMGFLFNGEREKAISALVQHIVKAAAYKLLTTA